MPDIPRSATDTDSASGGFRELARQRGKAATEEAAAARRLAKRRQYIYYVPGVITAVAAGVIATNFLPDGSHTLLAIIGVIASVGLSVGTFLKAQQLARVHWARHANLGRLAKDYETLAEAVEEPTKQELNELSARWESANLRGTDEPPPPAVAPHPK